VLRVFVLAHREYINRVLTTGFWVSVGAFPLLLGIVLVTAWFHTEVGQGNWGVLVLMAFLWLGVVAVSPMLLTCIVEERANRTVEALLSCLSPSQILAGKMMGIAASGLTAVAAAAVLLVLFVKAVPGFPDPPSALNLPDDLTALLWLSSYFLLGFMLYATVLAGIGSAMRNLRQAHASMVPATIVLFLVLPIVAATDQNPNGMLAQVFSYIPPLTPFVMMRRVVSRPSSVDLVITTALLVVAVALGTWRLSAHTRFALTPTEPRTHAVA
jgi:ABC-2 type transport system permease protein